MHFAEKFLQTNSVDPEQMPHSAASELGLHCFHVPPKEVSSLKRVTSASTLEMISQP